MKTSSLMMCALVALTACGTGVKQSVRTPVEMGERIELMFREIGTAFFLTFFLTEGQSSVIIIRYTIKAKPA